MTNKAFSILLLFTLVFGGALGAAFAAGVALGKSQGPDSSQESAGLQTPRGSQGGNFQPGGFQGGGSRAGSDGQTGGFQGRQPGGEFGSREGGISSRAGEPPVAVEGGSGPDAAGQIAGGSEGVQDIFGRVDIIEDNVLTMTTFQGTVQVTLQDDTTIQNTVEGTIADLVEGVNIRIMGRPDQEGNLQARSITLLAEDLEEAAAGRGGRGDFGRIAPVTGTIISVEEGLLTVDSPEGPVTVAFQAETTIQKPTDGAQSDLVEGIQVRVTGVSGEAGAIVAQSLIVVPADAGRPFGRRGNRGIQ